jgi:hypothetical protein
MALCINSYQDLGGGEFRGFVHDETQEILASCDYMLVKPSVYLTAIDSHKPGDKSDAVEIDYSAAAGIFSFFFGVILSLWLFAKCIGLVLQAIRRF